MCCVLLQMARLRSTTINYETAKAMNQVSKDADMSPFSACTKLFEPRNVGATANPPRYVARPPPAPLVWLRPQLFDSA
jgi:hypothetical protein